MHQSMMSSTPSTVQHTVVCVDIPVHNTNDQLFYISTIVRFTRMSDHSCNFLNINILELISFGSPKCKPGRHFNHFAERRPKAMRNCSLWNESAVSYDAVLTRGVVGRRRRTASPPLSRKGICIINAPCTLVRF